MEKKTLGTFLAVLRKSQGMTQKELAQRVGVSDKTISHWERDESAPDISVLPILGDIFGVTVDELLRGEKLPGAAGSDALSEKSEKQLKYLMEKNFHKFELGFWAALCIAFIGTLLAILLHEWVGAPMALTAGVFAVAAILVVGLAASNAEFALKSEELPAQLLAQYRERCGARRRLAFLLIDALALFVVGLSVSPRLFHSTLPAFLFPVPFAVAVVWLFVKKKDAF